MPTPTRLGPKRKAPAGAVSPVSPAVSPVAAAAASPVQGIGEIMTLRAQLEAMHRKQRDTESRLLEAQANIEDKDQIRDLMKTVSDLKTQLQFNEGDRNLQSPPAAVHKENAAAAQRGTKTQLQQPALARVSKRARSSAPAPATARFFDDVGVTAFPPSGPRVLRNLLRRQAPPDRAVDLLPSPPPPRGTQPLSADAAGSGATVDTAAAGPDDADAETDHGLPILASFLSISGDANVEFTSKLSALLWNHDQGDSCLLLLPTLLDAISSGADAAPSARCHHALRVLLRLVTTSQPVRAWFLSGSEAVKDDGQAPTASASTVHKPATVTANGFTQHPSSSNRRVLCKADLGAPALRQPLMPARLLQTPVIASPIQPQEALQRLVQLALPSQQELEAGAAVVAMASLLGIQILTVLAESCAQHQYHVFDPLFENGGVELTVWSGDRISVLLDLLLACIRMPSARLVIQRQRMLTRLLGILNETEESKDALARRMLHQLHSKVVQLLSVIFAFLDPTQQESGITTNAIVAIAGLVKRKLDVLDILPVDQIADHAAFGLLKRSGLLLVAFLCRSGDRAGHYPWKNKIIALRGAVAVVPRLCYFFLNTTPTLVDEQFLGEIESLQDMVSKRDEDASFLSQAFN